MLNKFKTLFFGAALALLGTLQYDPFIQFVQENTGLSLQIIGGVVVALRFITTQPIFAGLVKAAKDEKGSAGLVVLVIVLLGGLAGNSYLAAERGFPIEGPGDVKEAAVSAWHGRQADYSNLNE